MQKILLSGATGLIGGELLPLLQANQYEIITMGRKSVSPIVEHIYVDFSTNWSVDVLPKNIDIIIHLSQSEYFREFPQKVDNIFQVNTHSTLKLLEYARQTGVKSFIYASSGGIYGNGDTHFSEDYPLAPAGELGFYLSSKLCSEILIDNYSKFFNIQTLRFFFVYGKNQKRSMLIPRLVDSVKEGKSITLQGGTGIKINPIHVSDATQAILSAIELKESNKINIAGKEILSLFEIVEIISQKLNKKALFMYQNTEAKHLIADIQKMEKLLHKNNVTFREGIQELCNL